MDEKLHITILKPVDTAERSKLILNIVNYLIKVRNAPNFP